MGLAHFLLVLVTHVSSWYLKLLRYVYQEDSISKSKHIAECGGVMLLLLNVPHCLYFNAVIFCKELLMQQSRSHFYWVVLIRE